MARLACRNRWAARAVNTATAIHQSVPLKMKIEPRSTKATALWGESAATNCGRKARKNSATFGFNTLVSAPCKNNWRNKNTWRNEIEFASEVETAAGVAVRASNIFTPM